MRDHGHPGRQGAPVLLGSARGAPPPSAPLRMLITGADQECASWSCAPHGNPPTILRYSSSLKARIVSVRTLPCELVARANFASTSSFGASAKTIASYRPCTRWNDFSSPPSDFKACLAFSNRLGLSLIDLIPCSVYLRSVT